MIFFLGGGGVGKSYLIQTTSQWIDQILRDGTDRNNPDMPTFLKIAFTGVAAKNIGGTTFHTALSFKGGYSYDPSGVIFYQSQASMKRFL